MIKKESKKIVYMKKPLNWLTVLAIALLMTESEFLREPVIIFTLAVFFICMMRSEYLSDKYFAPNHTYEYNKQAKKKRIYYGIMMFLILLHRVVQTRALSTAIFILFLIATFKCVKSCWILEKMDNWWFIRYWYGRTYNRTS